MESSPNRLPLPNSQSFRQAQTPRQQYPLLQSSSAMAPLQSPHCAHPTAAKSPASKTPARESSRPAAAAPRSPAPHRARQFPNPPATRKLPAPPPHSVLPARRSALRPISAAKFSRSARATRALSRFPPPAPHFPRSASASPQTALPIPEFAFVGVPPTRSAISRALPATHAARPPSAFAYDPALRGCDANTQSNPPPRAIPATTIHAPAR